MCSILQPSNAHYYLHDDEEVVRLLQAMATSSQRMAATRAADKKALTATAIPVAPPLSSPVDASGRPWAPSSAAGVSVRHVSAQP